MLKLAKKLFQDESGQGMVEYGLILALIAVVVIAFLGPMGEAVGDIFDDITTKLTGATEVVPE